MWGDDAGRLGVARSADVDDSCWEPVALRGTVFMLIMAPSQPLLGNVKGWLGAEVGFDWIPPNAIFTDINRAI